MKTYSTTPGTERLVTVVCNLCGSSESQLHLAGPAYTFVRCAGCGLVYQNPQPVFDDLKHRYDQDYFSYERGNETNFFKLMLLGMRDVDFDPLEPGIVGRRFLDVGCATGMLLEHMAGRGWEVTGVDLTPQSAAFAREHRGVPVVTGTLFDAGFPDDTFSVIHFSHLIEHVPDPAAFLAEVHRVLRPGGIVLVTTPNVAGLQARLFGTGWRSAIADHLYLFSKPTLRKYLTSARFEIHRLVTWGGLAVGTAPAWLKRRADNLAKRWGFGDVMLFLARKPELP